MLIICEYPFTKSFIHKKILKKTSKKLNFKKRFSLKYIFKNNVFFFSELKAELQSLFANISNASNEPMQNIEKKSNGKNCFKKFYVIHYKLIKFQILSNNFASIIRSEQRNIC